MDVVARDLRARLGMLVYSVSWFNLLPDRRGRAHVNALFAPRSTASASTRGDIETNMMLALT